MSVVLLERDWPLPWRNSRFHRGQIVFIYNSAFLLRVRGRRSRIGSRLRSASARVVPDTASSSLPEANYPDTIPYIVTSNVAILPWICRSREMFQKFSILTPTPILGYGYPLDHFWYGIHTYKPNAIIVDAGSTDPGPYLLGTGLKLCSKASYIRDLTPILDACHQFGIKFLVSSAGGSGSNEHVDELVGLINEICEANGYSFKVTIFHLATNRRWHLSIRRWHTTQ